jgi:N-acetylglucosaminyl-diphospho-decaprenol L-rhamnosyltransferase
MARVAVVIVTYTSAGEIGGCIDALTALPPSDTEIVVVDNASTDTTVDEVVAHRTGHNITLISNSRNAGFRRR